MALEVRQKKLFFILSCFVLADAQAQDGSILDTDIVDLGQSEVMAMRQGVDWVQAPFSVTSLDSEELQMKLTRNLTESLAMVPGVMVQKTANGHGSPFLRGFTGYRTLALIDGVRYNNSVYRDGPNEYFSLIDLATIDRIDLIQGPASVMYGSDAIGGTLNLLTKGTDYIHQEGMYSGGEFGYRFSSAESSHQERLVYELGRGGDWGLRFGFSAKQYGDVRAAEIGTQKNTGYDEFSYDVRFDKSLSSNWRLTMVHQKLEQNDVWRTHSTIFGKSFAGTTLGSDLRRLKDQRRTLSYVKLKGEDLGLKYADDVETTFSYQTWDENGDRIRGNGRRNVDFFDSAMTGLDVQLTKRFDVVEVVYGFDVYRDEVDSGRVDFNPDGSVNAVRVQGPVGDDSSFLQAGIYAQADWKLSKRLSLTAGARVTYVDASIGSYEDPATGLAASFADSWTTAVSSARVRYALTEDGNWNLWAGISQSFRAPNVADLSRFGGSRSNELEVAAINLDPEKFLTFEVGLKAEQQDYELGMTYYYTKIDDFITSTPTGRTIGGLTEVSKKNSSEGFVQGFEVDGKYFISDELSVWGNATWLEGELDVFSTVGSTNPVREPLSRIMPTTINAGIEWKREDGKYWAGVDVQWAAKADKLSSGDRSDTQRIPLGGTPSYTRINLYGGYQINDEWSVNMVLNNVLDEAYRVHGSGNNEPGFGVNFGVKGTF